MRINIRSVFVILVIALIAAVVAVMAIGAEPAQANHLTSCKLTEKRGSAVVICGSVKKAKGKDKLRVVAVVRCSDGDGFEIERRDKTPAKATEQSIVYCTRDFPIVIEASYEIVA